MKCNNCDTCLKRVGWIGLAVSIFTAVFTITIGYLNGSKALMATSLCAGIDAITALTVIMGVKLSGKSIDLKHPYGHGKIEFVIVSLVSILLIVSAIVLFFHSAVSLYHHQKGPDQWLTLAAALVATGINEIKHRYAKCVGLQFNSPAILTHAKHAHIDAVSSASVSVGVICARIGLHFVDPLIAIFEIGHILKASYHMLTDSLKSLMDVSVSENVNRFIRDRVSEVKGVRNINYLRARQLGQEIWIEISIFIDSDMTMFEGKTIADNTRDHLMEKIKYIGNVQVQFLAEQS